MRVFPVLLLVVAAVVAVALRLQRPVPVLLGAAGVCLFVAWLVLRFRRPRITDWHDAEVAAARWLNKAGCRQVEMTGAGPDGGLDVITAKWAVQVKHIEKRVGRPVLQQVVGAALSVDRYAAVVSTSGFSAPAFDYAEEHNIALLEMDLDGHVERRNETADLVGRRLRRSLGR